MQSTAEWFRQIKARDPDTYLATVEPSDVSRPDITMPDGSRRLTSHAFGRWQTSDVGCRVYVSRSGVLTMESRAQRDTRLSR